MKPTKKPDGSERSRDEQRADHGPQYGGEDWRVADERGEQRFGHARNDDADPSELKAEDAEPEDDNRALQTGMNHGEKPRKDKRREA